MLAQTSLQTHAVRRQQPLLRHRHGDLRDATDGPVAYVKRRFVPAARTVPGDRRTHTVEQGERLDNIAAQYLGDPTLFWRLCDANRAMRSGS